MIAKTILASGSVEEEYFVYFESESYKQLIRVLYSTVEVYNFIQNDEPLELTYRIPLGLPIQASFILEFKKLCHLLIIIKPYKVIEIYYDVLLKKIVEVYPSELQEPLPLVNNQKLHFFAIQNADFKRAFIYCQKFEIIIQVNNEDDKYKVEDAIQAAIPNNILYNTNDVIEMEFVKDSIYMLFKNLLNQLYIYKFPLNMDGVSKKAEPEVGENQPLQIQDHITRFLILEDDLVLLLGAKISILLNYATKEQYQLVFELSDVSSVLPTSWGALVCDFSRNLYGLMCNNGQATSAQITSSLECECFLLTELPAIASSLVIVHDNLMCGSKDGDSVLLDFETNELPELTSSGEFLSKINVVETIPHIGPIHCILNCDNDLLIAAGDEKNSLLCKITSLCEIQGIMIEQLNDRYHVARLSEATYALINQNYSKVHLLALENNTFSVTDSMNASFLYDELLAPEKELTGSNPQYAWEMPIIYTVNNTCILCTEEKIVLYTVISHHFVKSAEILIQDYLSTNDEVEICITSSILEILSEFELATFNVQNGEIEYLKTIELEKFGVIEDGKNDIDDENEDLNNVNNEFDPIELINPLYRENSTINKIIKFRLNEEESMLCYQQYNIPVIKCLDLDKKRIHRINLINKSSIYPATIKDIIFIKHYLIFIDGFNVLYKYDLIEESTETLELELNDCEKNNIIEVALNLILIQNHLIHLETMKIILVNYFPENKELSQNNEKSSDAEYLYSYCIDQTMQLFLYISSDGKLYCTNVDIFIQENMEIDGLCNSSLINSICTIEDVVYASNNYLFDDPSNNHQIISKYIINSRTHALKLFSEIDSYPEMTTRVEILTKELKNLGSIKLAGNYIVTKIISHVYMDDIYVFVLATTEDEEGYLFIYLLGDNKYATKVAENANEVSTNQQKTIYPEAEFDISEAINYTATERKTLKHNYELVQQIKYEEPAFEMCIHNKLLFVASLSQVHIYQFNMSVDKEEEQTEKEEEVMTDVNSCSYNLLILEMVVKNNIIYTLDGFKGLVAFEYDEKINNIKLPRSFPVKSPTCFAITDDSILIATSESELLVIQEVQNRFYIKEQIYVGDNINTINIDRENARKYIAGTISGKIFEFIIESKDKVDSLYKMMQKLSARGIIEFDEALYEDESGNMITRLLDIDDLYKVEQHAEELMLENEEIELIEDTIDVFE